MTPIKIFFVEQTGWARATFDDGSIRDFESKDAAGVVNWRTLAPLYRLPDGSHCPSNELPPGAVYALIEDYYPKGPDGRTLFAVLPNRHHWTIDSRASNCTRKDDDVHRCWCRHGRPEDGTLHVDKNGDTCAAGAGSIVSGDFHGFLHNGHLVSC